MVVAVHCFVVWPVDPSSPFSDIRNLIFTVISGRAPVILFFVLSAFVLSKSIENRRSGFLQFFIKRIFRLYPAAVAAIVLTILIAVALHLSATSTFELKYFNTLHAAFRIAAIADSLLCFGNEIIPPLWTLRVELIGSAVMPLLFTIMIRSGRLGALTIVVILTLGAVVPYHPFGVMTNVLLFCFGVGVFTYLYLQNVRFVHTRPVLCAFFGASICTFAHALIGRDAEYNVSKITEWLGSSAIFEKGLGPEHNIGFFLQHIAEATGAAILVAAIAVKRRRWGVLENSVLAYFGRISYAIYLVHYPLLLAIVAIVREFELIDPSRATLPFLTFAVLMAISTAIAKLLHHAIELPGIRAGRLLSNRFETVRVRA